MAQQHPSLPVVAPVQYARDYEDVSVTQDALMLPPQYNEAWGERGAAGSSFQTAVDHSAGRQRSGPPGDGQPSSSVR